ncbi:hypothetical protein BDZ45DRAFT_669501 [Acephala macrosclerotiorum]|nr:hypothetical protein BDZ45DRAFT_669501 [Acephala macrosclerotiorum]
MYCCTVPHLIVTLRRSLSPPNCDFMDPVPGGHSPSMISKHIRSWIASSGQRTGGQRCKGGILGPQGSRCMISMACSASQRLP